MNPVLYLFIFMLLATGCSTQTALTRVTTDQQKWLLSGAALPGAQGQDLDVEDEDILTLTDEMKDFAEFAVSGFTGRDRVKALLEAILFPSGLDLKYDANAIFTAEETFRYRRANCLSFTNMFIAMARHVGFEVKFNEVDVPPVWDLQQRNTLVLNNHVNAVVIRLGSVRHVVDLNIDEFEVSYDQRYIADKVAHAQHYNNKAMTYLISGQHVDAFRYLAKAVRMEPGISYLWSNLGSLYRRTGNLRAAELAYLVAIRENPEDLVAISNVARLYEENGNTELAQYYEQKAHYYRLRNPYYLYGLAMNAFLNKDYKLARENTEAAIEHYDKEHRFYFLLGAIYQKYGDKQLAVINYNRAVELSGNYARQAGYRRKMEMLLSMQSSSPPTTH